jgi:hypothetical protein
MHATTPRNTGKAIQGVLYGLYFCFKCEWRQHDGGWIEVNERQ